MKLQEYGWVGQIRDVKSRLTVGTVVGDKLIHGYSQIYISLVRTQE